MDEIRGQIAGSSGSIPPVDSISGSLENSQLDYGSDSESYLPQTSSDQLNISDLNVIQDNEPASEPVLIPPIEQIVDEKHDERQSDEEGHTSSEEEEEEEEEEEPAQELNNKRIILQRFTIYNSLKTMYIVGSNARENLFRILEVGKPTPEDEAKGNYDFTIIEDTSYFYTRKDMFELINVLNETIEGGIHKVAYGCGLLGFIKFTKGYYISIITKASQIAVLGGHHIYHINETELISLDINYKKPDKHSDEDRLLTIYKYFELGKTFYFSYTYDITNNLQTNFLRQKRLAANYKNGNIDEHDLQNVNFEHNERFVWNKLLLKAALDNYEGKVYEWFQPIIHGFIDQANISIYGKKVYITIVARRSRHFAGARFLKRGVNDKGNVANEVETEQIVSDMLITSFHDPKYGFYNNPRFTSFVQHRGSIPLYWTQDLNKLPKPPIEINYADPFYKSASMHFNGLFKRYGSPILINNLIKTKEKTPRESKLFQEFLRCVEYLNQFLPEQHKLQHHSFDMSRASKKNHDVINPLEEYAVSGIEQTGFFHNGTDLASTKLQTGIIRTNCIDCLDRTNAAQFIIGKNALGYQLASLGLVSSTKLDYDSDIINILTEIFHDHGDTIAIQYGGSNLVNTMDSYRRINQWSSHTRDYLNSIKRMYSNSFMDSLRQEAINLFLGNYVYEANKPKLWEMENDFYLHNEIFYKNIRIRTSYIHWYNEKFLTDRHNLLLTETKKPKMNEVKNLKELLFETMEPYPNFNDNWFSECYAPRKFSSLSDLLQYNMNSNARYFPQTIDSEYDYSPFESRRPELRASPHKEKNDNSTSPTEFVSGLGMTTDILDVDEEAIEDDEDDFNNEQTSPNKLNYLGLQSSQKKIKEFVTSRIERLGYGGVSKKSETPSLADSDEKLSASIEFKDLSSFVKPKLNDNDMKIYNRNLNLATKFPEVGAINKADIHTSINLMDGAKVPLVNQKDISLYRFHSADKKSKHDSSYKRYYKDLDLKDLKIYNEYFNNDDDLMNIYRFDNYFK